MLIPVIVAEMISGGGGSEGGSSDMSDNQGDANQESNS